MLSHIGPAPDPDAPEATVIALGDESRRDEGAGPAIASVVRAMDLSPLARVTEQVTSSLDLIAALEGTRRLIIVASVQAGASPGTLHVLSPASADAIGARLPTLAGAYFLDAIELAGLAGERPQALIVGLEPAEIAPSLTLSPEVAAEVPEAAERVRQLIEDQALWDLAIAGE